jgi:hypothetical protein
MITKKLIINALLAGAYVGIAVFAASGGEFTQAALSAAAVAAARAAIGYFADHFGKTVPVDA